MLGTSSFCLWLPGLAWVYLYYSSSVIYGVFLAVGCFFFALARVRSPNLALFSIFGTIFLDIICVCLAFRLGP